MSLKQRIGQGSLLPLSASCYLLITFIEGKFKIERFHAKCWWYTYFSWILLAKSLAPTQQWALCLKHSQSLPKMPQTTQHTLGSLQKGLHYTVQPNLEELWPINDPNSALWSSANFGAVPYLMVTWQHVEFLGREVSCSPHPHEVVVVQTFQGGTYLAKQMFGRPKHIIDQSTMNKKNQCDNEATKMKQETVQSKMCCSTICATAGCTSASQSAAWINDILSD